MRALRWVGCALFGHHWVTVRRHGIPVCEECADCGAWRHATGEDT